MYHGTSKGYTNGSGIDYPTAIIEITPAEFERLTRGDTDIRLPRLWTIDSLIQRVPEPAQT